MNKVSPVSMMKNLVISALLSAGLMISHHAIADDGLPYQGGIAAGEFKFLGNISGLSNACNCSFTDWINPANESGFDVNNHFKDYWNQLSPENSGKWGVVQSTNLSVYNWNQLFPVIDNYVQYHGIELKYHTLVWGSQTPTALSSLSRTAKRDAVQTWIQAACGQLEMTFGWTSGHPPMVDVVNEPINTTNADFTDFKANTFTLTTGPSGNVINGVNYDWVVWSFEQARQFCPHQRLLLNEFNVLRASTTQNTYISIAKLLKSRNLIDGLGTQSHQFEVDTMTAADVTTGLNNLDTVGVPLYITELDIDGCDVSGGNVLTTNCTGGTSDNVQNSRYQSLFPLLWEHATVNGVTLWGYVQNETWKPGTNLITTTGVDRPAMTWLKNYFATRAANGIPGSGSLTYPFLLSSDRTIQVRAHGKVGGESINLLVNNQVVATWTLTTAWNTYTADSTLTGDIRVQFTNDNGSRDVQVDYISVNGHVKQAEAQAVNTGRYANGRCGGAGFSEWLNCNGYIDFGNL